MFLRTDKKICQKFSNEIFELTEIQISQVPFCNLKLSQVESMRLEICLYIFNLSYVFYFFNRYINDKAKLRKYLDDTYDMFLSKFYEKFKTVNNVNYSEIVVNQKEQNEIIIYAKSKGLPFTLDMETSINTVFNLIFEFRSPLYYEIINQSLKNSDNDKMFYSVPIYELFSEQFNNEKDKDIIYGCVAFIDSPTMITIVDMIRKYDVF